MTSIADGRIISNYKLGAVLTRGSVALGFLVVVGLSTVAIVYQLARPDFYFSNHQLRYGIISALGFAIAMLAFWRTIVYMGIIANIILRKHPALVFRGGELVVRRPFELHIDISDITGVSAVPYDRAFGRPERVKLALKNGLVQYIRCDILDHSGIDLVREISELAHISG